VGQISTITGLWEKAQGLPEHHLRAYQTGVTEQAEERGPHGRARTEAHALGLDAEAVWRTLPRALRCL